MQALFGPNTNTVAPGFQYPNAYAGMFQRGIPQAPLARPVDMDGGGGMVPSGDPMHRQFSPMPGPQLPTGAPASPGAFPQPQPWGAQPPRPVPMQPNAFAMMMQRSPYGGQYGRTY